jgi:hypothetical protein
MLSSALPNAPKAIHSWSISSSVLLNALLTPTGSAFSYFNARSNPESRLFFFQCQADFCSNRKVVPIAVSAAGIAATVAIKGLGASAATRTVAVILATTESTARCRPRSNFFSHSSVYSVPVTVVLVAGLGVIHSFRLLHLIRGS